MFTRENRMLLECIAEDLGYTPAPNIPEAVYADQIIYGATAQSIIATVFDADPLLGNHKVGVTRDYLETRSAHSLKKLALLAMGLDLPEERAVALIRWMINKLIFIGELWCPAENIVACTAPRTMWYCNGHARISGSIAEKSNEKTYQAGLCRYRADEEDRAVVVEKEKNRLERERLAILAIPEQTEKYALGIDPDDCIARLQLIPGEDISGTYRLVMSFDLPLDVRDFLTAHGWPYNDNPLDWDRKTKSWLVKSE